MEKAKPQKQSKFTTGILAQVWQVNRSGPQNERQSERRLIQIEFRLERAKRLLRRIERRAEAAIEDLESTERRFETLKDSFYSLQQEWKNWKNDNKEE